MRKNKKISINKRNKETEINSKKLNKIIKKVMWLGFILIFLIVTYIALSNILMIKIQGKRILSENDAKMYQADCILILGAGVWSSGPSPMLEDRLLEGIRLYNQGTASKIIVSGDHGTVNYDEVNVMKDYLIKAGVPSEDIFMDHAGFSTYESMVRAKKIFSINKMVIVTQKYHLYRALFIARQNDIDAIGVNSDPRIYAGQKMRDIREIAARSKDVITCLLKIKPKYLGETIDISGDGNITNDL